MANKVTIDVEARFVDNITDEAKSASKAVEDIGKSSDKAQKQVDNLSKKKAKPLFDADDNKFLKKIRSMEAKMTKMGHTKTAAVLDVVDKATNKIGKVLNKAQSFAGKTWQSMLKFKDSEALNSIKKLTNAAEGFTKKTWTTIVKIKDYATAPLKKIKDSLFSIKSLVMAITAGLAAKQFIINPINLADQYSSAQIGFSTLLGASEGQAMMDKIDQFAKKTPFKTSGVISNVQKMMAYGWDVDRVIEDMETIGDAAAATGKGDQGLENIVYALSEIRSKGKLSTQELNQLAGAGIKAKAYLAQGLGYGTSDAGMAKLAKKLESGAIGANQAIDLILEGMKEFDGMMDKTANETVEGLKGQIEDAFEINVFRRWGQGLQDGARNGFGTVVKLLDEMDGALGKFGDTLYEIGKTASNWLAEKFAKATERILEITDTFEFKNASLGEKISMLWKGVIVDPLKEWWEGGGRDKTVETAGKIGRWMGETLTKGLLAIFGMTDVLKEGGLDESKGMSVGQSFAKGFVDGFDVSAITSKLVDAIKNVWNFLPWWAKLYIGGKAISGVGNVIGGIGGIVGGGIGLWGAGKSIIGSPGNTIMKGTGVLGGLANIGYWATGGVKNPAGYFGKAGGMSGGVAALSGAGVVAMGAGAIKSGLDFYGAYKAHKEGDYVARNAKLASGGTTLGGMAIGAGIGTAIGGPVGTLIGGGIGAVVGWIAGDEIAANIEAAKWESEEMRDAIKDGEKSAEELAEAAAKANWEHARKAFGDISLSMEEIQRLANQIVWGDDLTAFEQFNVATKNAEANLLALKEASQEADKWMWKAGLGVKFNVDEQEAFKQSFTDYVTAADSYLENKHYEFSMSADLLLDLDTKAGKTLLESGNAFYADQQDKLTTAGEELGNTLTEALADGIISADESEAIAAAQRKVAEITAKIAEADAAAEMELIKLKWGDGNLDLESFETFMATMNETINNRVSAADDAFEVQVSNLRLRYGDPSKLVGDDLDAYNAELQALKEGYQLSIEGIKAEVKDVEIGIVSKAFEGELPGTLEEDTKRLSRAIDRALRDNISPEDFALLDDYDLANLLFLGADFFEGKAELANNLRTYLSDVLSHMETIDVDVGMKPNIFGHDVPQGKVEKVLEGFIDKKYAFDVSLLLTGNITTLNKVDPTKMAEKFGISEEEATDILLKIKATESIEERINLLPEELGITPEMSQEILVKIMGRPMYAIAGWGSGAFTKKGIAGMKKMFGIPEEISQEVALDLIGNPKYTKINPTMADFGIQNSYWFTPIVNLNPKLGTATPIKVRQSILYTQEYRGGIVGGSSAMEAFATGGLVRGGARLIKVAEEGSPEMIIPLSSQRRERGLKLWEKAGHMLGVPGFARGGLTNGGADEGIRFQGYGSGDSTSGQTVQVDIGGITFEIHVDGEEKSNIVEAIKAQAAEIADVVAGVLADAFDTQFENTPTRGGVA